MVNKLKQRIFIHWVFDLPGAKGEVKRGELAQGTLFELDGSKSSVLVADFQKTRQPDDLQLDISIPRSAPASTKQAGLVPTNANEIYLPPLPAPAPQPINLRIALEMPRIAREIQTVNRNGAGQIETTETKVEYVEPLAPVREDLPVTAQPAKKSRKRQMGFKFALGEKDSK